MATRGTIAVKNPNGTITAIYTHWDGYIANNGKILEKHYRDPHKIAQLMELGDLSTLGELIGEKHPFDNQYDYLSPEYNEFEERYGNMCTAYGRDREESRCEARTYGSVEEWLKKAHQEFNYLWDGEAWHVETDWHGEHPNGTLLPLADLVAQELNPAKS